MSETVRVCLLLAGESIPNWQATAIRRLVAQEDVEVTLTVVNDDSSSTPLRETIRYVAGLREWAVVGGFIRLWRRVVGPSPHEERASIEDVPEVANARRIRCRSISVDGWKQRLPDEVVQEVATSADVAIRFGFGVLVGDVLTAPEHGVLSYHHGDLREYRGQPMGFWEFVHGCETAGVTLQRLNETLDGGEIVATEHVDIDDADRWGEVKSRLFEASEEMLTEGVRNVRDESFEPETPDELGDLYTLPRGSPVATYVYKSLRGIVRSEFRVGTGRGNSP